MEIKWF